MSSGGGGLMPTGTLPVEIRLSAMLLTGGATLFLLVGLLRMAEEGAGVLQIPALQLLIAIGVTGGILRGMRVARIAGVAFALLAGLIHAIFALESLPLYARIVSAIVAMSQVYAAVLLNTRPALAHTGQAAREPHDR